MSYFFGKYKTPSIYIFGWSIKLVFKVVTGPEFTPVGIRDNGFILSFDADVGTLYLDNGFILSFDADVGTLYVDDELIVVLGVDDGTLYADE